MQPFTRITDFDEGHKLLKFHPAHKQQMEVDHNNGDFVMFKNDDYVFGIRTIQNGNKAGNHIQGFRGSDIAMFADYIVNLTRQMGLPYVWFATTNQALVDEVNQSYKVIEHESVNGETVYKIAVGSGDNV